jgi:hypothetical protein
MTEIPLRILKAFPDRLEETWCTFPETHRTWRPESWEGIPSEPLSALEQLCHLRDIETDGYHVRFSRILNENTPTLASIDGLSLAVERKYADSDPETVLLEFRRARARTLDMLSNLMESQLGRMGDFGPYGRVTVRSLAHHLASHDFQHLSGLQWLLGKMSSSG